MPVAFEEEGCDDGDVEEADARGEEVCCVEVVVDDAAEGGKADEVEAELILFEEQDNAEEGDDMCACCRYDVACPRQSAVEDEVGDRAAE